MSLKNIFLPLAFLSLCGCKEQAQTDNQTPLAQVYTTFLYKSEVDQVVPKDITPEDSLLIAHNYIKSWVTNQLLLHKAVENLSNEERQISKQVEDYKTSLLIHIYKQKLIEQRLNTDIPEEDIQNYYDTYKYNFLLSTPICKALYFIVPKDASNIGDLKKWFQSDKEDDLEKIESYCITNARKYDNFQHQWIEVKHLLSILPSDQEINENDLLNKKNLILEDDNYIYFMKLQDICRTREVSPYEYIKDEICMILKNKKKLQFENELEDQINEEANNKNRVKIFD